MSLAASEFVTGPQDEALSCSRMRTHGKEFGLLNACHSIYQLFSGVVHFHSGASSFMYCGPEMILIDWRSSGDHILSSTGVSDPRN